MKQEPPALGREGCQREHDRVARRRLASVRPRGGQQSPPPGAHGLPVAGSKAM